MLGHRMPTTYRMPQCQKRGWMDDVRRQSTTNQIHSFPSATKVIDFDPIVLVLMFLVF
jgi:hypothetical protein